MKIAVDLDDVLLNFVDPLLEYYNSMSNKHFSREQMYTYSLWKVFGITRKQSEKVLNGFYETDSFRSLQLIEGAQEGVITLSKEHSLYIITSRITELSDITHKEIEKNFPDVFKDIFFSYNMHKRNIRQQTKAEICRDKKINLIIEDSPEYAVECKNKNVGVLLFSQSWNISLSDGIPRADNWEEVLEKIGQKSF